MTPKTLVILTRAFPYYPGEQFLEDEAPYWCDSVFAKVTLLPAQAIGQPRAVPPALTVDTVLANPNKAVFAASLIHAAVSPFFLRELLYLIRQRRLTLSNVLRSLSVTALALRTARGLAKFAKTHGKIPILYSYWNDGLAYGSCIAKRRGHLDRVVSRAHGGDLYEERNQGHLPLKRQFILDFDAIATLSDSARGYMEKKFGVPRSTLTVRRLGVPIPDGMSKKSGPGAFHVVSLSYCIPVKRIDRIVVAVAEFAKKHPTVSVAWTHIGDGLLKTALEKETRYVFKDLRNARISFCGELPNEEVKRFFLRGTVDVFLNASDSEGIPVSIMEAMACAVPAIAPNTGGIADLVNDRVGLLLQACPAPHQIADALGECYRHGGWPEKRVAAREHVQSLFDASKNYPNFVFWLDCIGTR